MSFFGESEVVVETEATMTDYERVNERLSLASNAQLVHSIIAGGEAAAYNWGIAVKYWTALLWILENYRIANYSQGTRSLQFLCEMCIERVEEIEHLATNPTFSPAEPEFEFDGDGDLFIVE
jgi:hypothetical protein